MRRRIITVVLIGVAITVLIVFSRLTTSNLLEQIVKRGELVVLSRNGPTSYYEGPGGPTGFEYDMLSLFAEELGVELKIEAVSYTHLTLPTIYSV